MKSTQDPKRKVSIPKPSKAVKTAADAFLKLLKENVKNTPKASLKVLKLTSIRLERDNTPYRMWSIHFGTHSRLTITESKTIVTHVGYLRTDQEDGCSLTDYRGLTEKAVEAVLGRAVEDLVATSVRLWLPPPVKQ